MPATVTAADLDFFLDHLQRSSGRDPRVVDLSCGEHERTHCEVKVGDMRRYLRGHAAWYVSGDNSPSQAVEKTKHNIGFAIRELPWQRRVAWRIIAGVGPSTICHA